MKLVKLGEIGKIVTGCTPSTKKPEYYENNDYMFVGPSDIKNVMYVVSSEKHISQKAYDDYKTRFINRNSIVVDCIGSDMGNVAIVKENCLTNQQINAITNIDESNYNIKYVYYVLSTMKSYFHLIGTNGSTMPILNKSMFENIEIEVPDIEIQNKIANILSKLDDRIKLNSEINNNLYELSQRIYNQWFVEFEYPVNSKETYKSSKGIFKEEDGNFIPEEFTICNLDEICECQNGHAFYKDGYDDSGLMVIDLGNVSLQGNFIYTNADKFISRERIPNEKFIVKKNDLVMIMTDRKATMDLLGKTAKIYEDKEYALNQRIYRIRPRINVNYVYSFLNSNSTLDKLKGVALGSVQKYVNTNHINELRILVPSVNIMNEYSKIVDPIFKRMEENILENRNLEIIRDTLLPKLTNGEIDLNNIEI